MARAWFVRAGKDDEFEEPAFAEGVMAIGWDKVGDLSACSTKADVASLVAAAYPEVSARGLEAYVVQLHVFRSLMQAGDIVVLLRSKAPDIALGRIAGDYHYNAIGPARHVRPVRWVHRSVRRSEIPELTDPPALSVVYLVKPGPALERLEKLAGKSTAQAPQTELTDTSSSTTSSAYENLSRNLNYARNLTSAGSHLQELKVNLFEVTDVYRAAWVQAVAALDHWVHQEICDRMDRLAAESGSKKPRAYAKFELPLDLVEKVQSGHLQLAEAVRHGVRASLAFKTYQSPEKIQEGLRLVADVANLWQRVAAVLSERTEEKLPGQEVLLRLREIVQRRNKIAHEYDEDPANPPAKHDIDAEMTMQTINWLDRLALALLVVLDQE